MRTFALSGFAALAISMMAPTAVWAWSSEPAPKGADGANLAEQEDPLKALQDKVDAKSGGFKSDSGFYITGSASQPQSFSAFGRPYGFQSGSTGSTSTEIPFGVSPQPGFRGPVQ
jgi:hypothetical protein